MEYTAAPVAPTGGPTVSDVTEPDREGPVREVPVWAELDRAAVEIKRLEALADGLDERLAAPTAVDGSA